MSQTTTGRLAAELRTNHLTEDERYRLLADEVRRLALDTLAGQTASMALQDLAVEVATRKEGGFATEDESVDQLMTMLHHAHLPMLDEMDVVDYDPETNVVDPRTENR